MPQWTWLSGAVNSLETKSSENVKRKDLLVGEQSLTTTEKQKGRERPLFGVFVGGTVCECQLIVWTRTKAKGCVNPTLDEGV